jgi:hypothetical protein
MHVLEVLMCFAHISKAATSPAARTAIDTLQSWIDGSELALAARTTRKEHGSTNFEMVTEAIAALEEEKFLATGNRVMQRVGAARDQAMNSGGTVFGFRAAPEFGDLT